MFIWTQWREWRSDDETGLEKQDALEREPESLHCGISAASFVPRPTDLDFRQRELARGVLAEKRGFLTGATAASLPDGAEVIGLRRFCGNAATREWFLVRGERLELVCMEIVSRWE